MSYPYTGWKNKGGTSDRTAPGGSWKKYWESQTDESWPFLCSVKDCNNIATDGAHMYCPSVDRREWIIPTCHSCNMKAGETFTLKKSMPKKLVSANINK